MKCDAKRTARENDETNLERPHHDLDLLSLGELDEVDRFRCVLACYIERRRRQLQRSKKRKKEKERARLTLSNREPEARDRCPRLHRRPLRSRVVVTELLLFSVRVLALLWVGRKKGSEVSGARGCRRERDERTVLSFHGDVVGSDDDSLVVSFH